MLMLPSCTTRSTADASKIAGSVTFSEILIYCAVSKPDDLNDAAENVLMILVDGGFLNKLPVVTVRLLKSEANC